MRNVKVIHVVGARPNFMKLSPVYNALKMYENFDQVIIHTGQHYDYEMSDVFFQELGISHPDVNLSISGKSVLQQIGHGILKLEEEIPKFKPDLVIIYGDINATAYTAIVCSKMGIKIAHVEAGLRSFDRSMPEETNRIIADSLSDYFFTPSKDADINLLKSGVSSDKIFFVGNVMIDTLINFLPLAENASFPFVVPPEYGLVTLHRPSNVDDESDLEVILQTLKEISQTCPIIFPVHPRTKSKILKTFLSDPDRLLLVEPLGYLPFLKLQKNAKFIITDSGGVQEESTYLGVPCFTLRENTERPVTIDVGTNVLVGKDLEKLKIHLNSFLEGQFKKTEVPELWDGNASRRIAKIINKIFSDQKIISH